MHQHHRHRSLHEEPGRVAQNVGCHGDLVVGLVVHEDEVLALAVEHLHLALVDRRPLDLLAGAEGAVDHRAGSGVLEGGAHEGGALARLDVLELHDAEQVLIELEGHAVPEVVGRDGGQDLLLVGSRCSVLLWRRPQAGSGTTGVFG